MKLAIEISDKRISDLLHGHGGGYSPWIQELSGKWNSASGAKIKYDLESDNEGDGKGRKTIRKNDVQKGIALFVIGAPEQFADFIVENDDDICFDSAWQFIIFGKLIYG